ncbi:thymidine kinase [uncultured bacterium]|nr:thymidine kinase [uncultured bacterium]
MSVMPFSGGWIEVVAGVMFSGKSEELMRRVRRAVIARKRVQVFKSHLDSRYAGLFAVSSHDGRSVEAIPVDSSAQVAQRIDPLAHVIAVDEAQFMDEGIVEVATSLASRGRRVIIAGLDTDFRGEPFGPMPRLMAIAEMVDKLHAICVLCGAPATRTQRLIDGIPAAWDSPTIMVGGREAYEARCRACHVVRPAHEAQREIFRAPDPGTRSNGA